MNVVARLREHAPVGGVLVGEEAWGRCLPYGSLAGIRDDAPPGAASARLDAWSGGTTRPNRIMGGQATLAAFAAALTGGHRTQPMSSPAADLDG